MKKLIVAMMSLFLTLTVNAQDKKIKDATAIKNMCGCFEVTFNFAETFNYSNDSLYKPSKVKVDKALELAQLIRDDNDKIAIQHLLVIGSPSNAYIVKHWRQDWIYENRDFYFYNGDNHWIYKQHSKKDVKGQWTQKVFQVDDSPRYEGTATWVHVDGKSYWENTTNAPLPRRELTTRSDYNITARGNRHEITDYGWLHDQDNHKVLREPGKEDEIIAKEKGYNTYVRVADERCKPGSDWWQENKGKWQIVRNKWDEVFSRNTNLSLERKVENKRLYKHLFSDDYTTEKAINDRVESFIIK